MYTGVTDAESKETGDAVKYPTMHMKVLPPPPKIELSGPNVNSVKILRNFALENKDIQDKGHRDCITSLLSLLAKNSFLPKCVVILYQRCYKKR